LLDLMKAKVNGAPYDQEAYNRRVQSAVAEVVRKQIESGVDVVTDGEQDKAPAEGARLAATQLWR
jgi:5-methyltetrahydropteroyltriglutamate--homocysteine methyltransferase